MSSAQPRLDAQPTLDTLGTPLFDVTFVVLDLETTGLSPASDRITEVGAVKVRRGEIVGEMQTLVHPGRPISAAVTTVTGITDHMVRGAPPIGAVLPTVLEFLSDSVLVAHNARFDVGFLDAELTRHGYSRLTVTVLDTARLARRLLRDEVRDCRLATLARHLHARTMPAHRALTDARATVDVLHGLLERAGSLGATTLEDLLHYSRSSSDRLFRRISLVADAPRAPGVYRFVDARGEPLYVGKATDLRARLRQYFGQDPRRRIADMLRETTAVTWTCTPTEIEASVREVRAIIADQPRYNRRAKRPDRAVWLKLTAERFPRLSIVTSVREDGARYVGPIASRRMAQQVIEAIHEVQPIRQCTMRLRVAQDHPACALKDLGRCGAPCDGSQSQEQYARIVDRVAAALHDDAGDLLTALRSRMKELAAQQRFEQAARVRRRLHTTARVLLTARRLGELAAVPELCAVRRDGAGSQAIRVQHGVLVASATLGPDADDDQAVAALLAIEPDPSPPAASPAVHAEELRLLLQWIDAAHVRALRVDGILAEPVAGGAALHATQGEARRVARQVGRDRQRLSGAKVTRRAG